MVLNYMYWSFGNYLDRLINEKGWNRSVLAKKAGLSHVYVQQLVTGVTKSPNPPRPTIDTLLALSSALNVPVANLIAAYQGKDPDADEKESDEKFAILAKAFVLEAIATMSLEEKKKILKVDASKTNE